jgi:hypothetical protein
MSARILFSFGETLGRDYVDEVARHPFSYRVRYISCLRNPSRPDPSLAVHREK